MKICGSCPYRRDADRSLKAVDRHLEQSTEMMAGKAMLDLCEGKETFCLGQIIFWANQWAGMMFSREEEDVIEEWARDEELIFSAGNEFVRYHRGEEFGSMEWRKAWKLKMHGPPKEEKRPEDPSGQLSLF